MTGTESRPTHERDKHQPDPLSRRAACLLLALLVATNLALGLRHLRHGLPDVFHPDSAQIGQAASLLRSGWFADYYNYPTTLVFVYAGAALATFELEQVGALGAPTSPPAAPPATAPAAAPAAASATPGDWAAFVERFEQPLLAHTIGRMVSVLAGAVLVLAVYRLGRVRFSRTASLLAAAAIAVDPVLVATEHQVRPHVPMVAAIVLAAPWMLRLVAQVAGWPPVRVGPPVRGATVRNAVRAGAAAGVAAAVLQVGLLLLATGAALLLLVARPLRRAAGLALGVIASGVATAWLIDALFRATGAVRPVLARSPLEDPGTLALPRRLLSFGLWTHFPQTLESWLAAAPALVGGVAVFGLCCWRARRASCSERDPVDGSVGHPTDGPAWRDLLLYGSLPLVVLVVMGTLLGGHVRYLLAAAPFLAVLAAAGCLAVRPRWPRLLLAALLVGEPLMASLRYHALLDTIDTRVGVDAQIEEVNGTTGGAAGPPLVIALQDRLVLDRTAMPPGAIVFPAYDDLARWGADDAPVRKALRDSGAAIYARVPDLGYARGPLDETHLSQLGFSLYGTIHAAPVSRLSLPDIPDHILPDVWLATRTGPAIELWVAGTEAAARLQRIVPPAGLDAWTSDPARIGAAAGRAARRPCAAPAEAFRDVRCDVDGDGEPDDVASNVDADLLARLLALPTDRWRDAGEGLPAGAASAVASAAASASAAAGPPHLQAHGTLLGDEPVLMVLTRAAPRAPVHVVAGTRELRARFAGGVLVPAPELVFGGLAAGADGALAFSALWPHDLPIGFTIIVQCWIRDSAAPRGFSASNAVSGTTPG